MKITATIILLNLMALMMLAQTPPLSPVGEYYLRGEMETAAGFKLNSDSTFQFFFSYGALDREGKGRWKTEKDQIIFDSKDKPSHDFKLTGSKKQDGDKIRIAFTRTNPNINKYFHAIVRSGGKELHASANSDGIIILPVMKADTIVLFFEWCTEKQSVFAMEDPLNNDFVFELQPTIFDVVFNNFKMHVFPDKITGPLPFSGDHICSFIKEK